MRICPIVRSGMFGLLWAVMVASMTVRLRSVICLESSHLLGRLLQNSRDVKTNRTNSKENNGIDMIVFICCCLFVFVCLLSVLGDNVALSIWKPGSTCDSWLPVGVVCPGFPY